MTETWLPILGYGGYYEVSDLGRVRALARVVTYSTGGKRSYPGRILVPFMGPRGYWLVAVSYRSKTSLPAVHSLVAKAFHGPRPEGLECRHLDGDRDNNRVSNLQWGTHSENRLDQIAHGTDTKRNRTHCPRGHPLQEPNLCLRQWENGRRACRSCAAAREFVSRHPLADFKLEGDRYYNQFVLSLSA